MPWVRLPVDHGPMDVLSSRVLLHPTDPERSRAFYRDGLGLAIYREFGSGPDRGTVFFWVAGSWSCRAARLAASPGHGVVAAGPRAGRGAAGARRAGRADPAGAEAGAVGLLEMWVVDPDGVRICLVEVLEDHRCAAATDAPPLLHGLPQWPVR